MSRKEIRLLKLVKARLEMDALEHELTDHIKEALYNINTLDGLYKIRDYIDQLLLNWKQPTEEGEDTKDGTDN